MEIFCTHSFLEGVIIFMKLIWLQEQQNLWSKSQWTQKPLVRTIWGFLVVLARPNKNFTNKSVNLPTRAKKINISIIVALVVALLKKHDSACYSNVWTLSYNHITFIYKAKYYRWIARVSHRSHQPKTNPILTYPNRT